MKKVEAIIRTEKLEDLKDALVKHDLAGMTVTTGFGLWQSKVLLNTSEDKNCTRPY